jgi:hypothetical protein
MLHITTQEKTNHHKKHIALEITMSLMMMIIFFVPASKASDITVDAVIKLVNKARETANVAALKNNTLLQKAAEEKAQDMINNNYFAHVSPQGKSPWYWIDKNSYDYAYAGENLAINFTNAEDEQKAWMDSPTHKKNILNPNYDETGVAVKQGIVDGKETIVVVQMFGKQVQQTVANSIETKTAIAGAQSQNMQNVSAVQKISNEISLDSLYNNNAPTLIGWSIVFGLAILLVLVDVAAIIHKKHKPFFLEHKTHNV